MTTRPTRRFLGLATLILIATCAPAFADVVSLIAEGRQALVDHKLSLAVSKFTDAQTAAPANGEANCLLALTRLAAVVDKPETQILLTKIGVPAKGRNVFNWMAELGKKLPAALTSDDLEIWAKNTLLPVLEQSRLNLAAVTSASFQTSLSQAETGLPDVIIDQGDVLFLGALAAELKSSILMLDVLETKLKIADLFTWRNTNLLTVQKILATYPKLLNLNNAANVAPALTAYSDGVTLYGQAVVFIRNRADNTNRLFVLDPESEAEEIQWRAQLTTVQASIQSTVAFNVVDVGTQVFAGAFKNSPVSLRTLLPEYLANHPKHGTTVPDVTFHGVLPGMTQPSVDAYFAKLGDYLDRKFRYRADPVLPTVTLTSPKANTLFKVVDNAGDVEVAFAGKAADNRAVTRVEVEIDGDTFVAQGTTTWNLTLALEPQDGAYVATVRSFDAQGNASKPASVSFRVRPYFTVVVPVVAGGVVAPIPKAGQLFEGDRKLILTATPMAGFLFDGWTITDRFGEYTDSRAKLEYFPNSAATLAPVFHANPFMGHAGRFNGVFTEEIYDETTGDFIRTIIHGYYSFNVTKTGFVTGFVLSGGRTDSVKGQLNSEGNLPLVLVRKGLPNGFMYLTLDFQNGDGFHASFSADNGATWFNGGTAPQTSPRGLASKYTAYLSPTALAAHLPQGFGYLTATHDGHGGFRFAGALADGTPFTAGSSVDGYGQLPFFAALDKTGSLLGGVLALYSDLSPSTEGLGGTVYWKHRKSSAALVFKTPYTTDMTVSGDRYVAPVGKQLIAPLVVNGATYFSADEFAGVADFNSLANVGFTLGAGHKLLNIDTPAAKLALTFTPASGRFTGSFVDSAVTKKHAFNGVIVAGQGGFGFFYDAAKNGPVTVSQP